MERNTESTELELQGKLLSQYYRGKDWYLKKTLVLTVHLTVDAFTQTVLLLPEHKALRDEAMVYGKGDNVEAATEDFRFRLKRYVDNCFDRKELVCFGDDAVAG